MARKGVFANITSPDAEQHQRKVTPGYASRGASRSMMTSLSELAEKAAKADLAASGDIVIEIDPAQIDESFVSDRIDDDEAALGELVDAIRERGQDSPVLVRPHPLHEGRYQTVFGHRRVRAAKALGRPVKAVVRTISDVDHIIAQGQENSARENLSFIERAAFAQRLLGLGYDRTVIQQALSVDAPMLTRMLSVSGRVPSELIEAIGSAKGIGRDRWLEFTTLFEHPLCAQAALALVDDERLTAMSSESRFGLFLAAMRQARKPARKATTPDRWHSSDDGVTAEFKGAGRSYSIALKSKDAARFGRFVAQNLERLHQEFVRSMKSQGD